MATITIDPALKKLLDELPVGDPDKRPDLAEVWLAFAPQRPLVPIGVTTHVTFGPWCGPRMALADVVVHIRHLATGKELTGRVDNAGKFVVHAGIVISARVTVRG